MDLLAEALFIYYTAIIAVFCVYGLHRFWLVGSFLRTGGIRAEAACPERFETLPTVTVQLPMFNEPRVAERVIEAAAALDYPVERLQIQVLDDSTDETRDLARAACERVAARGVDVEYRHRADRAGFKAGALDEGLATARGEFVALFDADFVPPADFLGALIHDFTDPSIGLVQARWAHLNRDASWLTRLQAFCLDGHLVVEQTARSRTGRWFNFNGTAGIWRRRAIDEAGGWEHDTLTEDTDLSYRAQMAGWRFRFRPDVTCPAELPDTVRAFVNQQHRWTKGLLQNAIKLGPRIARADAPIRTRLDALLHLTSPLPYAAMALLTLLVAPAFATGLPLSSLSAPAALALGLVCLGLGSFAAGTFLVAGQRAQGRSTLGAIASTPALMALGIGLSMRNTAAIVEAVTGHASPFVRTPKAGAGAARPDAERRPRGVPAGLVETALGAVMLGCIAPAITEPFTLVGAPFLVLFAAGYLSIGVPQLRASMRAFIRPRAASAPSAG